MSPALATILALLLYAALLLPLAWSAYTGRGRGVGFAYAGALVALCLYQTGIFHGGSLTAAHPVAASALPSPDARCRQIVELIEQAGLSVEHSAAGEFTITGPGVEQLPEEAREIIGQCYEPQSGPPGMPPEALGW